MKKLIYLGAIVLGGFSLTNAQTAVKANPLALLGGSDLVSVEFGINDVSSVQVGGGIGGYKLGGYKYSTWGAGAQYRYYFSEVMDGWYAAGNVNYTSGNVELKNLTLHFDGLSTPDTSNEADLSGFGIGARAGYQWLFDSGFLIDLNVGASYTSYSYKWKNKVDETTYKDALKSGGVLPQGSVGIGYKF